MVPLQLKLRRISPPQGGFILDSSLQIKYPPTAFSSIFFYFTLCSRKKKKKKEVKDANKTKRKAEGISPTSLPVNSAKEEEVQGLEQVFGKAESPFFSARIQMFL